MVVFTRVVERGSFSAAARALSLTPSAISKLVARLEERLGAAVFTRSSRHVAFTAEGQAFHGAALRAIEAVEAADEAVRVGGLAETLRVRFMPTFAAAQLAPVIP